MKLPQFVPILTAFTARVAGREISELLKSPAALARALADTQTVVGHDGVLCLFDTLLLASACIGSRGETVSPRDPGSGELRDPAEVPQTPPLATILESIQPLRHHLQGRALVFATFAGPGLLFLQLQKALGQRGETDGVISDYVAEVVRNVVRTALEFGADGIALIEQSMPENPGELLRSHKMVRKLADFYDAGFLVFRLAASEDTSPPLQAHCVFDLITTGTSARSVSGKLGPATTSSVLPFTTAGDVAESTQVEELRTVLQELRSECKVNAS